MPANQLITKPREEVDLTLTVTDGNVMPCVYHLHDVFGETVMLDEVYQDGQRYVSKKLPRIGARFDMLRKPTLYR